MSSSTALNAVLVTGGGGFLGSHVVRKLLNEPGCRVYSASRNPSLHHDQEDSVTYEAVDIANDSQVEALFQKIKPQVVIHTTSPDPLAPSRTQEQVNIQGTRNLLKHAASCVNTRAFVFTGSDSGMVPNQNAISEEQAQLYTATDSANPYGKAKGISEALVLATNGPDLRTVSVRVPGMYGDFDYKGMLPQLLSAIHKGQHKTQIGNNTRVFEVLDVHKAAEAHIAAAKAVLRTDAGLVSAPKVDGEAFFISDGHPTPYWDFFRRCYAAAGAPVKPDEVKIIPLAMAQTMASLAEWAYAIFTLGYKKPQMRRQNMDHFNRGCNWSLAKARERLGYEPLTVAEQDAAIKRMMDWGIANLPKP
ncbi:erg26, C-3 sterol dehydrogenase [Conoideocrella luteorostrata]|uniref:Erg26, C-3 sterol dehydrogenase n=1 Tax=Conoideocrella luteorostrata TaxID=1105319 RepID=A0AAJ0CTL7_9HYPO|nr:erg26, C-3 sterol dehydrogenase [Conoideocrella luteorostrata]